MRKGQTKTYRSRSRGLFAGKITRVILVFQVIGLLLFALEMIGAGTEDAQVLRHPKAGEGSREETIIAETKKGREEFTITVEEQEQTRQEEEETIKKAQQEIEKEMYGENDSAASVCYPLVLASSSSDGQVGAAWEFRPSGWIGEDGSILELPAESQSVAITAYLTLTCGDTTEIIAIPFVLRRPPAGSAEAVRLDLKRGVASALVAGGSAVRLPKTAGGSSVQWRTKASHRGLALCALGLVCALLLKAAEKEKAKEEAKRREQQLSADYGRIVEQLALYLGAGLTPRESLSRIARSGSAREAARPGFALIAECVREAESGAGDLRAYKDLGEKSGHRDYKRLSLLLMSCTCRGERGINAHLLQEEADVRLRRRNRARTLGEEASTKLVFPMIGMLLMILAVLIVPAMMNLNL